MFYIGLFLTVSRKFTSFYLFFLHILDVTLHQELENVENIWSLGSLDRLLLGFANQPSQRRDEFVCDELTNHLFQSRGFPFGMDLTAINIQRGRDHGLPPYTAWRKPCGLTPIQNWKDLERIMNPDTVHRFQSLYEHVDDIDLFSGGLAEKPVRGGIVGPTFACIIAQQFLNLRKGDRFWYENGGFESSFTPAQLQQIRHVTFSHVLCQTLTEIETIQPFVFLSPDDFRNARVSCDSPLINKFDLSPWIEDIPNSIRPNDENEAERRSRDRKKKRKRIGSTTRKPKPSNGNVKVKVKNTTTHTVKVQQTYNTNGYAPPLSVPQRPTYDSYNDRRTTLRNDMTYLFGMVPEATTSIPKTPFEVNIKIQYYPPSTPKTTTKRQHYDKYETTTKASNIYSDDFAVYRPSYVVRPPNSFYESKYEDLPFSTSKRPYVYSDKYIYSSKIQDYYTNKRPQYDLDRDDSFDKLYSDVYATNNKKYGQEQDDMPKPINYYSNGDIEKLSTDDEHDKFDFYGTKQQQTPTKYIKISSVKGQEFIDPSGGTVHLHVAQREGDLELESETTEDVRLVDLEVLPDETKWLVYNATEEIIEPLIIPDFNFNFSSTNELPRPFSETFLRRNWTGLELNATET